MLPRGFCLPVIFDMKETGFSGEARPDLSRSDRMKMEPGRDFRPGRLTSTLSCSTERVSWGLLYVSHVGYYVLFNTKIALSVSRPRKAPYERNLSLMLQGVNIGLPGSWARTSQRTRPPLWYVLGMSRGDVPFGMMRRQLWLTNGGGLGPHAFAQDFTNGLDSPLTMNHSRKAGCLRSSAC